MMIFHNRPGSFTTSSNGRRGSPRREDGRLRRGAMEESRREHESHPARRAWKRFVRLRGEKVAMARDRPYGGVVIVVPFVIDGEVEGRQRIERPIEKAGRHAVVLSPYREFEIADGEKIPLLLVPWRV